MIRLEGATLPAESLGAVPPILIGDVLRDVPGIPIQVGWSAVLADNCGVTDTATLLRLSGPDLSEVLAAVPSAGVVQIENEWLRYTGKTASPAGLTIGERGYRDTDPAPHPKGAGVYFVETRPLYVLAYVPAGCRYPDDMVVQIRVNDNAETPPVTVRLQDTRLIPGVRLVTAEFDASKGFYAVPPPSLPSSMALGPVGVRSAGPSSAGGSAGAAIANSTWTGRRPIGYGSALSAWAPPPPPLAVARAPSPVAAPFAAAARLVSLRQGPLGRVSADLRGLLDTSGGRYTGTPAARLETPAHVVRLLLEDTFGETDPTRYHAPTWARTAARQSARGLTWRLMWTGDAFESFREHAQTGGHADLYIDEDGRWRYAFRESAAPAVATLTPRELLADPGLGWSAGRDVITVLEVEWGSGLQRGSFTLESPAMVKRHGPNHGALALPYAATEPVARQCARAALSRRDRPRQSATVTTSHVWLPLTLRDRVFVDTPLLRLYGAARIPFDVVGLTDRGEQRVLALLEADPVALELLLTGTLERGGVRLELPLTGSMDAGAGLLALALSGTLTRGRSLALGLSGTPEGGAGLLTIPLTGTRVLPASRALALSGTRVLPASRALALSGTRESAASPPTLGTWVTRGVTAGLTLTQSYTTGPGEDYLLAQIGTWDNNAGTFGHVTSVAFGGTPLTRLAEVAAFRKHGELWGGPVPAGTTATLTVTFQNNGNDTTLALVSVAGVVRVGAVKSQSMGSPTTTSSLTFDAGDVGPSTLGVDFLAQHYGDTSGAPGGSQTPAYASFQDPFFQTKLAGSRAVNLATLAWAGLNHGNSDSVQIGVPLVGA